MKFLVLGVSSLALLAGVVFAAPQKPKAPAAKGFPAVAKLFKAECARCHTGEHPAGEFDVSSYAKMMEGSEHGKMIVPGKPGDSPLMGYLKGTKKPPMPMGSKPLTAAQMKLVSDWIAQGAKNK